FADDTTILVKNFIHLSEIETKIACYEKASNAKSNPNKSTLLLLTRTAREETNTNNSIKKYNVIKEREKLTILGFHFNSDFQMHPVTCKTLISKLQTRCNILKRRNISLKGHMLTAGLLLISKIWYTSYVFSPLMSQADDIQR